MHSYFQPIRALIEVNRFSEFLRVQYWAPNFFFLRHPENPYLHLVHSDKTCLNSSCPDMHDMQNYPPLNFGHSPHKSKERVSLTHFFPLASTHNHGHNFNRQQLIKCVSSLFSEATLVRFQPLRVKCMSAAAARPSESNAFVDFVSFSRFNSKMLLSTSFQKSICI